MDRVSYNNFEYSGHKCSDNHVKIVIEKYVKSQHSFNAKDRYCAHEKSTILVQVTEKPKLCIKCYKSIYDANWFKFISL